jgi:hypothetical protein
MDGQKKCALSVSIVQGLQSSLSLEVKKPEKTEQQLGLRTGQEN